MEKYGGIRKTPARIHDVDRNTRCIPGRRKRPTETHHSTENERKDFALLGYTQRKVLLGGEKQEAEGILTEWEELRAGCDFAKTLLKLQVLTNPIQAAKEGKTPRRDKSPNRSDEKLRTTQSDQTRKTDIEY